MKWDLQPEKKKCLPVHSYDINFFISFCTSSLYKEIAFDKFNFASLTENDKQK